MPGSRTQNTLVAGLAVVAVGASAYAVWSVNRPHPSLVEAGPVAGPVPVSTPSPDADGATESTGGPTSDETDETATTSPAPAAEDTDPPSVDAWLDAWSGEADLLVVGDGFSNLPTQWVQLWAQQTGSDRPVQIHHWGEAADVSFNDPIVLSDAGDAPLTVWSASRAGSSIQDAADRYGRFVDASAEPDAVLVSLGLDSGGEDIAAGLDALVGQIDADVPVLLAVGPQDLYDAGVGDALLSWAQDNDDRVAVVDLRPVAPGAPTAEEWAAAFGQAVGQR